MPTLRTYAYIAPSPRDVVQRGQSFAASGIPLVTWICIVLTPLLWLFGVLASSRSIHLISLTLLSILPAVLVGKFVLKKFADEAVTKSFLISQFFLGAFLLSPIVVIVDSGLALVFGFILFSSEIVELCKFPGLLNAIDGPNLFETDITRAFDSTLAVSGEPLGINPDMIFAYIREHVPLWKMIVYALFSAFIVAGLTDEVAKWMLARRYREVNKRDENLDRYCCISCKGILSVACMGALGFATIENYGFVMGLRSSPDSRFGLRLVSLALFRGFLAFPVHVGAQFYVAVAAAQSYIFREPIGVVKSLSIAALIHGLFDAISLVTLIFVGVLGVPPWVDISVIMLQACLTILLVVVCRVRYKALLQREKMVQKSCNLNNSLSKVLQS
ncbi:unnamed protein product [Agarophyton chilense]